MYNQKFLDSLKGLTEGQARAKCRLIKKDVEAYVPRKVPTDISRDSVVLHVEKGRVLSAHPGDPTKFKK